ncbi:MAG: hypothetical protein ACI9VR_001770 [Cognaticolwellia sp.]|jgi:hypothetical protein
MFSTLSLLLGACTSPSSSLHSAPLYSVGAPETLPASEAVAAADLDGDGVDEVLRYSEGRLEWDGGSAELGGVFQRAARGDVDGDGKEEVLIATGMGRTDRASPARIWAVGDDGASLLIERAGPRAQVPELRVVDGKVWAALFTADNVVQAGWVQDQELKVEQIGKLALRQLPSSKGVVVGRVYGDLPKSDGDLTLHGPQGESALPSHRGVRSMALGDLDGDGQEELVIGDGWHYAYGTQAQGRVAVLSGAEWKEIRAIAHFPQDYSAQEIEIHQGRVLVMGTKNVHLLQRDALGWQDLVIAQTSEGESVAWVQGADGPAVVVSGDPTRLIPLL